LFLKIGCNSHLNIHVVKRAGANLSVIGLGSCYFIADKLAIYSLGTSMSDTRWQL
jgi:hypothetical protein